MAKSDRKGSMRARLRAKPGDRLRLDDDRAAGTPGMPDREAAEKALLANRERLADLQYKLFADGRFAILAVLQAIDAGGKDGTIRHVFSAFNPQGCPVTSFKVPSAEEQRHDFLWRVHKAVPARGEIGVFNRSHYEDVLVVRAENLAPREVWQPRYAQINAFERHLDANRIVIVKFFLHISRAEQRKRLEARVKDPRKNWKFEPADLEKRAKWKPYREAFEAAIRKCSTDYAPWFVIPADRKWYRNYAVSQILLETLEGLPLAWPKPKYDPKTIRIR